MAAGTVVSDQIGAVASKGALPHLSFVLVPPLGVRHHCVVSDTFRRAAGELGC